MGCSICSCSQKRQVPGSQASCLLQTGSVPGELESVSVLFILFWYTRDQAILNQLLIGRYQGYNKNLIDRFVHMGFDLDKVVEAFQFFGIETYGGQDVDLEPEYMGDITARLLGEP